MNQESNEEKNYESSINRNNLERFESIPYNRRILFLSHCIRKELKEEIQGFAEELGYQVHVVGGGSIVYKIITREKPQAVVGIACIPELEMAVDKVKIPLQVVELDTDGCKDTIVNVERSKKVLSRYREK